jgi:ribosome maturation factor RimP
MKFISHKIFRSTISCQTQKVGETSATGWERRIEEYINTCTATETLKLHNIKWMPSRIEVVVSEIDEAGEEVGPSIDRLNTLHKKIFEMMEVDDEGEEMLEKYEILLASPGVGDILWRDIDFEVFKGFPVIVYTTEVYKKKTQFEGTLVGRDEKHVSVSLKGRIVKIPRDLIDKVTMPQAKYEDFDEEIKKLR